MAFSRSRFRSSACPSARFPCGRGRHAADRVQSLPALREISSARRARARARRISSADRERCESVSMIVDDPETRRVEAQFRPMNARCQQRRRQARRLLLDSAKRSVRRRRESLRIETSARFAPRARRRLGADLSARKSPPTADLPSPRRCFVASAPDDRQADADLVRS